MNAGAWGCGGWRRAWLGVILAAAALTLAGGGAGAVTRCADRGDLAAHPGADWAEIRAACEAEQQGYIAGDPMGFDWFANAGNGFAGFPYILQRVLPDLAPEIWGRPEDGFARFGLFADPDASRPLPRGLGIAGTAGRPLDANGAATAEIDFATPQMHVVTLACGACHSGQVRTEQGIRVIEGAPNTRIDVRKWRAAYGETVRRYLATPQQVVASAARIAAIIDSKPEGYFYPPAHFRGPGYRNFTASAEAAQRAAVKAGLVPILAGFACGVADRAAGQVLQLSTSYGNWNSPGLAGASTGQQDGSGDLIFQLLVAKATPADECQTGADGAPKRQFDAASFLAAPHPEIPPFASNTDNPSVWNQQARSVAQWDGSVRVSFWRNIAAQLPIVGDPAKVDLHNAGIVANFLDGLPAAPYPFAIDMVRAERGEVLFAENCAACHRPRNATVYKYRDIGTDMNRASVLNGPALDLFLAGFAASCHDRDFRFQPRNGPAIYPCRMAGEEVLSARTNPSTQGYVASPLDGIWARAPYLHNGSVPTLYHLLVPGERPVQFIRGSIDYDRAKVGFFWRLSDVGLEDTSPTLMVYDTRSDSRSNAGHNRDVVVEGRRRRLNWGDPKLAEQLRDLLEYLKTQ